MKLLLVEDSPRLQRSISAGLRKQGYALDQAQDGQQALDLCAVNDYDVIILDLMLPKVDGLTVMTRLRQSRNPAHILILSARDQADNRILGLDKGADDYLVKPFVFDELLARIRALSRRTAVSKDPVISIGPLQIDTARLAVACNGTPIALTPTEFRLLEYLIRRRGRVCSQEQLVEQLYDSLTDVTKNTIEVHISSLRKKLKDSGGPALIETRRGFGYLIE